MNPLEIPLVHSLRRNHALEHATIHVLTSYYPYVHIAGRATLDGFVLYGNLPTADVARAAQEALHRLQTGESYLAVHPRCGTNLAVSGILAGFSSLLAAAGSHRLLDRLPRFLLATTAAVLLAQPLGPVIQERVTTTPDLAGVRIKDVIPQRLGKVIAHRVVMTST